MTDYTKMLQQTLTEYCRMRGITDMSREPQSKWNHFLLFARKELFSDRKALKVEPYDNHNLRNGGCSNNGAYDTEVINDIADAYFYLCYENDKEISAAGFSKLTGISSATIFTWDRWDRGDGLNSTGSSLIKKLRVEREESLSNKLWDSKNPIAALAMLNAKCGWRQPLPQESVRDAPQSMADLNAKYGITQDTTPEPPQDDD